MAEAEQTSTITPPSTACTVWSLKPDDSKLNLIGWAPDVTGAVMMAAAVYQARQAGHFDTNWRVAVYDNRTPAGIVAVIGLAP